LTSGLSDTAVSAALDAIYEAAAAPALWPTALQGIADCLGDVGAVMLWERSDGAFGVIASPRLAEAQRDYIENGWNRRDIRAIRAVERALWLRSDAVTDLDAVEPHEMDSHPMYTEFLARHGLRWACALGLQPSPDIVVAISIQRAAGKPPFSAREAELATQLGRHAERALRLSIRLLNAELIAEGLGASLARLDVGVLALDARGRVVFRNSATDRLLGGGVKLVDDCLRFGASANGRRHAAVLADALKTDLPMAGPIRPIIVDEREARPLVIHALPVGGEASPEGVFTNARLICCCSGPAPGSPPTPPSFATCSGSRSARPAWPPSSGQASRPRMPLRGSGSPRRRSAPASSGSSPKPACRASRN
jgi:PAS domain-containing protein